MKTNNKTKPNVISLVNDKLVIRKPSNAIYFLPHNNQPMKDELVLRVVLNYSEPSDQLDNQEKIKYHIDKNEEAIDFIEKDFDDLLFTDYSTTTNEIWLGFPKDENETVIKELAELDIVALIYVYDGENKNEETINIEPYSASLSAIEEFKISTTESISIPHQLSLHTINALTVEDSHYDLESKTLTIDLNKYKTENEIQQLFAYIYNKENHWEELINHLGFIIFQHILIKHEDKKIARINFDINKSQNGMSYTDRSIQLFPVILEELDSKNKQDDFLSSSYVFASFLKEENITTAIKYALSNYQELFKAILFNNQTYELIANINPDDLSLETITHTTFENKKVLKVKFNIFDNQIRMNLLFAYLAKQPINKEYWIKKISQLIIDAIEKNQLGNIQEYSFISFNENENNTNIHCASIGGISYKIGDPELDTKENEFKYLFFDKSFKFNDLLDLERSIILNIAWNRNTYLQYNYAQNILFPETSKEKREVKINENLEKVFNELNEKMKTLQFVDTKFIKVGSQLKIELNNFNNIEDLKLLFAVMNLNYKGCQDEWLDILSGVTRKAIKKVNKNINEIAYISYLINDDKKIYLTLPSIGGYSNNAMEFDNISPNEVVNAEFKIKDNDAIKKGLIYYLTSNKEILDKIIFKENLTPFNNFSHEYWYQFSSVGLGTYFDNLEKNTLNFDKYKNNNIGILETGNGLIDYNSDHFEGRVIVKKDSGEIHWHGDLVARITSSAKYGIDQYSTVISAGFGRYNNNGMMWNFLKSVDWLVESGVKLINCSWGNSKTKESDPDFFTYDELAFKLDYISRKFGIVIFKSAGNDHEYFKPYFRASTLAVNSIVVGSTTPLGDNISIFSDYEKYPNYSFTNDSPKPLIVTPGESYIYKYSGRNGTSFAAPVATGVTSILMKEFDKLMNNPAAVMATLAASSTALPKVPDEIRNNGLWNKVGAGLINYNNARLAAKNLLTSDIDNDKGADEVVLKSEEFVLETEQELTIGVASLFNGGYVSLASLRNLLPTKGSFNSIPIIGPIYSVIANQINKNRIYSYKQMLSDETTEEKLRRVINQYNLDNNPLSPPILRVVIYRKSKNGNYWEKVKPNIDPQSKSSTIKKYLFKNGLERGIFKYEVLIDKPAVHIEYDWTKNKIAATHMIRNKGY
ncbi:MAG: S8/S53 family peptidase [Ureaplasma sp.]|nr:S8/S53 family peptidase [Ureaplasma sp.]